MKNRGIILGGVGIGIAGMTAAFFIWLRQKKAAQIEEIAQGIGPGSTVRTIMDEVVRRHGSIRAYSEQLR